MKYRLKRIGKWIFHSNSSVLKTFSIILATAIISYCFASIDDLTQKVEILALFFICAVVIISALYINELLEIDDTFKKVHSVPLDATMRHVEKQIIFDDRSLDDGSSISLIKRTLHNHMREDYNLFSVDITSAEDLPDPKKIDYYKDGEKQDFIHEALELKINECYESGKKDSSPPLTKKMSFKLPLQVESNDICDFYISYRSKAFKSAIDGKKDFFSFNVTRFTEKMVIKISLTENIRNSKEISYPLEKENDGSTKKYEILDAAKEKMWYTERKIHSANDNPKIRKNKTEMSWKISEPKIGYTYIMYFTILDR